VLNLFECTAAHPMSLKFLDLPLPLKSSWMFTERTLIDNQNIVSKEDNSAENQSNQYRLRKSTLYAPEGDSRDDRGVEGTE